MDPDGAEGLISKIVKKVKGILSARSAFAVFRADFRSPGSANDKMGKTAWGSGACERRGRFDFSPGAELAQVFRGSARCGPDALRHFSTFVTEGAWTSANR
jgi:hypothetical protein